MKRGILSALLAKIAVAAQESGEKSQIRHAKGSGVFFPKRSAKIKSKIISARNRRANKNSKTKSSYASKRSSWH